MQILGIFGFEVLDEGLLPLPRQLGGASIGLALETFLALLFVLFRIFVHVREGHWEGHWSLSSWYSAPASAATLPDSTPLLAAVLAATALKSTKKGGVARTPLRSVYHKALACFSSPRAAASAFCGSAVIEPACGGRDGH